MEAREEVDPETLAREQAEREATRAAALLSAPHAEALRTGAFTNGLLAACRTVGHRKRILVRPVWMDSVLRLEGGDRRLELRPTPTGVEAVFSIAGAQVSKRDVDLAGDPAALVEEWLG